MLQGHLTIGGHQLKKDAVSMVIAYVFLYVTEYGQPAIISAQNSRVSTVLYNRTGMC